MAAGWIDISVPIQTGMVHWPGDPDIGISKLSEISKGAVCNVSHLSCSVHTGTHMDAPLHFLEDGKSMDSLEFDATIGPARVIEISDPHSIKPEALRKERLKAGERILFKTQNSAKAWKSTEFDKNFVFISKEAAALLAKAKVRTVGVDYLSVGGFFQDGVETHHALLRAGIWIIEGLNLQKVKAGRYELICLPIKVASADGAPARVIVRRSRK